MNEPAVKNVARIVIAALQKRLGLDEAAAEVIVSVASADRARPKVGSRFTWT